MKKLIALIAASFLALSSNAATLNYTNSVSGYADFISDVTIPQFNPVLGILKSVSVQAQVIERKTVALENRGATDQTFSCYVTNTVNITIVNSTADNVYTSAVSVTKPLKSFDGVRDYAGLSGYTTNIVSTNSLPVALTSISQFSGYSVLPVHIVAIGKFAGTFPGGAYASSVDDLIEVRIFVSYTFDPCLLTSVSQERRLKRLA